VFEDIEKAAKDLRDTKAGWVTRRDGADLLGKAAAMALATLHEHREEMDVDVRRAVDEALAKASAGLQGIAPKAGKNAYSLAELAQSCEKRGRREVQPHGDGFQITVQLKEGRHQTVYLEHFRRRDKIELVRVYTYCGAFSEEAAAWSLRANAKLAQGAIALTEEDGEERFVLMNCFMASEVTPAELKASVKEIAFYGDWMEQKLGGMDDF